MKRFFNADCDDATRISIVEFDDELDCRSNFGDEISERDLPADFSAWKRYTAHGVGNATVFVMSEFGE